LLQFALGCGEPPEFEQRFTQSEAHGGELWVEVQPFAEHLLSFLQVAAEGPWHFIEHISSQGIYGRERRVKAEDDLDLFLNGGQEEERPYHASGLPPPRRIGGVPEMGQDIPRLPLDDALGCMPSAVIGGQFLFAAGCPYVSPDEADLSQCQQILHIAIHGDRSL